MKLVGKPLWRFLFFGVVLVLFNHSLAGQPERPKTDAEKQWENERAKGLWIKKGAEITVEAYLKKYKVYSLKLNKEPDVGPNYATAENLVKGIGLSEGEQKFKMRPELIIGNIYQLKENLRLVSNDLIPPQPLQKANPEK